MAFLAFILTLLSACTPMDTEGGDRHSVKFKAQTKGVNTKTSYDGFAEGCAVIAWNNNDCIRLYSPAGGVISSSDSENGYFYADYTLDEDHITTSGRNSQATNLTPAPPQPKGLLWTSDSGEATFYGVYPNTVGISPSGGHLRAVVNIPDSQDGSVSSMPLVAKTSAPVSSGGNVSLEFSAAFTTFEFTLKGDTGSGTLTLNSISLSTPNTSIHLAGTGFQDIDAGTFAYNNGGSDTVIAKFDDPNKPKISEDLSATCYLFTLPLELSDLTLTVDYTKSGVNHVKSLALKQNGAFITFPAGKFIRIYGLAVPDTGGIRFFLSPDMVVPLGEESHVINY